MKESSGFVNYYKQAKKALDKDPKQKVKVVMNDDGSYTYTTPGIPVVASSSALAATSVPRGTAKSIAVQSDIKSAGQILYAKLSSLTKLVESGDLDDGALALAREKINKYKEDIRTLIETGVVPDLSPNNETTKLILEQQRQMELAANPNGTDAQRRRAQERGLELEQLISESLFAPTPSSSASSTSRRSRSGPLRSCAASSRRSWPTPSPPQRAWRPGTGGRRRCARRRHCPSRG
jgi:hypothetical protein